MVLVTVGVSTLYKPITKLPPYPTVDVHDFKPTKIDPKGIGIIERAIEHGIDSQAVLAEL